jgi:hypothetical protein
MDSDRIYNCLQMTRRFSEIMDGSAIRLRDDLREGRLEFAHALAGIANEFLFEFFAGAQMVALRSRILSIVSDAKNVPFSAIETAVKPNKFFTFAENHGKGGNFFYARIEFPFLACTRELAYKKYEIASETILADKVFP